MTQTGASPTFVVGTGRCGSTLISNLLREHPQILSLSEFFTCITDLGGRIAEAFPEDTVDGAALWRLVAAPPPKLATMMRHGVAMEEVLYRPGPGARFAADSVPAILLASLPHLTPAADGLFDDLRGFVTGLPPAPIGEQYRRLFVELARRFDRAVWVERSGGSLRAVRRLRRAFPDARFVHIVRDGRDCAISMSRHHGFRMALLAMQLTEILGVDPYESCDRQAEGDLPDELVPFLPERFDAEAFRRYETPLPLCGHYWSGEIVAGLEELAGLPADRVLTLHYEDFLAEPEVSIERLIGFVAPRAVDPGWTRRVAARVTRGQSSWRQLPAADAVALEEACRPGLAQIAALAT